MGNLFIISTPIGNLEDITLRALKVLFSVTVIACEDTRRTGLLLSNYESKINESLLRIPELKIGTKRKLISYYDQTEDTRFYEILDYLESGTDVALVSDSGTPLISDPGYKLIRECVKKNIRVIPVPGSSSVLSALVGSGLPVNNFLFLGYPSENKNKRLKLFSFLKNNEIRNFGNLTVVFFLSPHKLISTLREIESIIGDTEIVLARELTKMHEQFFRGIITRAIDEFSYPKGEFVLLININV